MGRIVHNGRTYDLGAYQGVAREVVIIGRKTSLSTTVSDLWPPGSSITGNHTLQATAGVTLAFSSTSTNDTSAGTGARTIKCLAIDASGVEHLLTGTLNGQTKVAVWTDAANPSTIPAAAFTEVAVNAVWCATWGTGLTNAGKIELYDSSDTVTTGENQTIGKRLAIIDTGDNYSRCGFYTVPDLPDGTQCDLAILGVSFLNCLVGATANYGAGSLLVNYLRWMDQTMGAAGAANWFKFDLGQIASSGDPSQLPPPGITEPVLIVKNGGVVDFQAAVSAAATVNVMAWGLLLIPEARTWSPV